MSGTEAKDMAPNVHHCRVSQGIALNSSESRGRGTSQYGSLTGTQNECAQNQGGRHDYKLFHAIPDLIQLFLGQVRISRLGGHGAELIKFDCKRVTPRELANSGGKSHS
jgi:hypothetical protein